MADGTFYIVRGARMNCSFGTHKRKINLPVSHGAYVNEKPMMNEEDNKLEENIKFFGICKGGSCPSTESICLVHEETKASISGKKCTPKFLDKWMNTKENTLVEGKPALTSESKLICAYSGVITFVSDGQQEK